MAELKGYKFRIYRSTSSSGPYTKIAEITGNTFEYDDENVVTGQAYYYCLATVDTETGLESSWTLPVSCIATGQNPPAVPSGVSIFDTQGVIALQWNASQEGDYPFSFYKVWRSLNGTDYNVIATTAETEYIDFAVTPGSTYYYRISAVDTEGLESDPSSPVSAQVQGTIIQTPSISGLSGADAVKLTWDTVTGAQKYRVYLNGTLVGETTENYFIYITTYRGSGTYYVRAVDIYNRESGDSNSIQLAPVSPSATITFPSSSPYNCSSPTIVIQGTSQEDFSIEYVELKVTSGSETQYTRASGAKSWQCPLTLENASYTVQARAKSIAGTISDWSASVAITMDAPATVYRYADGSWIAVEAANVRVHQELNKVATASFTAPQKSLEMKDRVSIRGSGVNFLGRVLTIDNTESDFWNYTCVDESYCLQKINTAVLEDTSWKRQGTINTILQKLFNILASEGYINFGIEASSSYSNPISADALKDGTVFSVLEQLAQLTSDVFYFDSKLGKLIFKPNTASSLGIDLVYGQNISGWKYEEHRENITNYAIIKGRIADYEFPIKDISPNYILGIHRGEGWNYDLYWKTLKQIGYSIPVGAKCFYLLGKTFKICSDFYTQEYTTGYIGIKISVPPIPRITLNFYVPVKKVGNPADLEVSVYVLPQKAFPDIPDIRTPTKKFTFPASEFSSAEKIITFSLDVDLSYSSQGQSSLPSWIIVLFSLPQGYSSEGEADYYMLQWVDDGGWPEYREELKLFALNETTQTGWISGQSVLAAPVVWAEAVYGSTLDYWIGPFDAVARYPYGEGCIILKGGQTIETPNLNLYFSDFRGILIKFRGTLLLDFYYGTNSYYRFWTEAYPKSSIGEGIENILPPCTHSTILDMPPYLFFFCDYNSYMQYWVESDYQGSGVLCSAIGWQPPANYKLQKIKIFALEDTVINSMKLVGKTNLLIKKRMTDYDPSYDMNKYGICPVYEEKNFTSSDEANTYVQNMLQKNSEPLISLTITYPYVANPAFPAQASISIPEIQSSPFTLKVIGCEWDLDNRTTELIFEAAPINYIVQALKALQEK